MISEIGSSRILLASCDISSKVKVSLYVLLCNRKVSKVRLTQATEMSDVSAERLANGDV